MRSIFMRLPDRRQVSPSPSSDRAKREGGRPNALPLSHFGQSGVPYSQAQKTQPRERGPWMKLARIGFVSVAAFLCLGEQLALGQAPRQKNRSQTVLFPPTGNFQNPGARSLGLGGAFVALADDASASELNPAGLTQLRRPEVTFEYRRLEDTTTVNYPHSASAGPFECVFLGASVARVPCQTSFRSHVDSLSFASLIVPSGRSLTFAFYRHELDREKISRLRPALDDPLQGQVQPGTAEVLERRIVRTGMAFAYAASEKFSAGVTVNVNSMTQSFRTVDYFTDFVFGGEIGNGPSFLAAIQDTHIQSQKLGGTGGLYWRPIRPLSLGVSYSTRVQFDEQGLRNTCPFDPATFLPLCGFVDGAPDPNSRFLIEEIPPSGFTLPGRVGASAAFRPTSWLLLIAEGDRVSYSDNDNDQPRFDENGDLVGLDRLSAKDVWEFHAGAEVVLPFSREGVIALRGGYWRNPDHSFRYSGCRAFPGRSCDPLVLSDGTPLFDETHARIGTLDHYAGGLGVAWSWGQLDVGYDWIRQSHTGTLAVSLVVRRK